MTELVRWTFWRIDDTEVDSLALDDDGAVRYRNLVATTGSGEFGWWDGQVDEATLDAVQQLVEQRPADDEDDSVPPAAGSWWVTWPGGEMRLADGPLSNQFAAMLAVCMDAATSPRLAARLEASVPDVDTGHVLLTITALGTTDVEISIDRGFPDDEGSFVTPDLSTIGYLGSFLTLPAGETAFASCSRTAHGGDVLPVSGKVVSPDGETEPFEVLVEVAS